MRTALHSLQKSTVLLKQLCCELCTVLCEKEDEKTVSNDQQGTESSFFASLSIYSILTTFHLLSSLTSVLVDKTMNVGRERGKWQHLKNSLRDVFIQKSIKLVHILCRVLLYQLEIRKTERRKVTQDRKRKREENVPFFIRRFLVLSLLLFLPFHS